jgi:curved DNA-binding protein CbpA
MYSLQGKTRSSMSFSRTMTKLALLLVALLCSTSFSEARHPNFSNDDDYYAILGITKKVSASSKEIKADVKAAYRKLALQYHPDKVAEDDKEKSEDIFIKISEAYAILSDDDKRKVYNKHGKRGLELMERGQDPDSGNFDAFANGFGAPNTFNVKFKSGGANFQFDPFSMFEEMFGAGGSNFKVDFGGAGGHQKPQKPRQAQELFKDSQNITKLSSPKFPQESSRYLWLIAFYDYKSPKSAGITSPMEKLSSKVSGTYKIGAFNCGRNKEETQFCQDMGIELKDLPLFGFFVAGVHSPYDLEGAATIPTARQLHEFATKNMPKDNIENINTVEHIKVSSFSRSQLQCHTNSQISLKPERNIC